MSWWVAEVRPDRKAPYLIRCRSEEEAEEKVESAEGKGLVAEKYHTGTDDIHLAAQLLRKKVTSDFGEETGHSNYAYGGKE